MKTEKLLIETQKYYMAIVFKDSLLSPFACSIDEPVILTELTAITVAATTDKAYTPTPFYMFFPLQFSICNYCTK